MPGVCPGGGGGGMLKFRFDRHIMDAQGKFGEHKRSVRVARGVAESNSSFLSAYVERCIMMTAIGIR